MKETIDLAIQTANLSSPTSPQSKNRFDISRSGARVAVLLLSRPAFRLGESIPLVIDFAGAVIPTYSVHVSLETHESVDPALALRSASSIERVTRKVHSSYSANACFARRLAFSLSVPPGASPEFVTSGVGMAWRVRVEFVTPRLERRERAGGEPRGERSELQDRREPHDRRESDGGSPERGAAGGGVGGRDSLGGLYRGMESEAAYEELLEEVAADDRGAVLAGRERLAAESFEVSVPVRVYGAVSGGEKGEGVGEEEGLVV